jgi:hypothetical protein
MDINVVIIIVITVIIHEFDVFDARNKVDNKIFLLCCRIDSYEQAFIPKERMKEKHHF